MSSCAKAIDWILKIAESATLNRSTYGDADLLLPAAGAGDFAIAVNDKVALIGALVIAYVEAITVFALPAGAYLKGAVALLIMVFVLLARPEGLFGVAFEEER